ncbi:lysophospholipid acyltransferase family protein [Sphingomicrobium lutaoense]|uniref:1-acyl-sn-glycerol-3-phosphate acyltransferase n=1 Tax=Sphingomicrobium lutaoense TaxID=515949 RepID=A0A839YZN7_9SPHN|nr:lysophospholipid acyltransferase family protein [Sphingomicrobium lutaoense]MBB3763237.1 1-acyl-sn-glycerol-3-phosphate acyltransferase [Sphingomicrobium lutaoense]
MPLLVLRVILLALALALLALPHLIVRTLFGSGAVARLFLHVAGWIMGLRVRRVGPLPPRRSLLLANHQSWLDILVLGSATGCAFVSKAEVKDHWLTGWLADQRDTLYIERDDRRGVARQVHAIAERFDHDLPLAIFPEGTTNDGLHVLPFRPSLLAAATPLPADAVVMPVALDYREDRAFVGWTAPERGIDNAVRILSRWRPIHVDVIMLPPLPAADRKTMAGEGRQRIVVALGASSERQSSL